MNNIIVRMVILVSWICHFTAGTDVRGCYYAAWAPYRKPNVAVLPSDLDPFLCTHIFVAFADVNVTADPNNPTIVPAHDADVRIYTETTALKQRNPSLKVLISVGGWEMGTLAFHQLALLDQTKMSIFVNNTIAFLRKYNFDGVDIDWEFPGIRGSDAGDKHLFTVLLQRLNAGFQADGVSSGINRLLLTAAVSPALPQIFTSYEIPEIGNYVDFFNLMTYDFHGIWDSPNQVVHHSALRDPNDPLNIEDIAMYWAHRVGKDKLVLGMPFYGRTYVLANPHNYLPGAEATGAGGEEGATPYYQVCQYIKGGAKERMMDQQRVPYLVHGNEWIGYDNVASIKEKAHFARQYGLRGAFTWAVDMDDVHNVCGQGSFPLMNAIKDGLAGH